MTSYSLTLRHCPSVRLSHSGIVSKRENVEGCGLHHWAAQEWLMGDDHVQVKFECKEVVASVKRANL